MIVHEPYGSDDPYKAGAYERYPRDPQPGQPVQVRFGAPVGARRAWAEVTAGGRCERVDAVSLGDGVWSVDLGAFPAGTVVAYDLRAEGPGPVAGRSFRFEVGTWVEVVGVARVEELGGGVRLWLETRVAEGQGVGAASDRAGAEQGRASTEQEAATAAHPATAEPAYLDLSSPLAGVLRAELRVGEAAPAPAAGGLSLSREGAVLVLTAEGLHAEVDLGDLTLTARTPGSPEPRFRGSLRCDWLAYSGGRVGQVRARFTTGRNEWLYGLGERFTDANRNGQEWDVRVYEEYKEQGKRTYLPIPFIVSQRGYGVWLDAAEPSRFDLRDTEAVVSLDRFVPEPGEHGEGGRSAGAAAAGHGQSRAANAGHQPPRTTDAGHVQPRSAAARHEPPRAAPLISLNAIVADAPYGVTAAFTRLTGDIAVPPRWAFAPWMSSNSWNSQALAEAAVRRTVTEDVPAGVVVIEAWSDESTFYVFNDAEYEPKASDDPPRLSDFRFGGRWPDPKGFVDLCHAHGLRVVLWQIPVMKRLEEPHAQHDADERHMLERGYMVREADGTPYRNKGWWFPGALILDFTNPAAREWWFAKRRYLFEELGIDGMKTDGGEHLWGRDLRAHDGRRGLELFNAYPNLYVGAYHEFVQAMTGNDGVTFSRAGYTGAQRFPGHWAGDEDSSWDAYRASIRAGLAAGVSGVSMWSWDLAGFSGEVPSVELYLRSTAMAVFSPLMQYHSEGHGAAEVRDRTPWNIAERHGDPRALEVYRRYAHLRMRLLDLIHEDALDLSARGVPLMRYPALEHPEEHDFLVRDPYAYLFGRDLLVAPVVDKGVFAREVLLPPGRWLDAWSGAGFEGPRALQASAGLERIPVFVRADGPRAARWLAAFAGEGTDG